MRNFIYLDFEEEIRSIDLQINELEKLSLQKGISYSTEIRKLHHTRVISLQDVYNKLSPWDIIKVARHPQRPILSNYLEYLIDDFRELHGDKYYGDDQSIITGFGKLRNTRLMIIGHNKGCNTEENIKRNFGCPNPEGYRKALQKMKLAEKFNIPIITFIDTPGAYPGIEAEERGQGRAIAMNLMEISKLKVPIINIIIGEGGSGGALGIGIGDRLGMLKYSYFSVISPEGGAAILWRDGNKAEEAALALKLTSSDLFKLKLIDTIIDEPLGGAHRNLHDTMLNVKCYLYKTLRELNNINIDNLVNLRYDKLRKIGKILPEK